MKAMAARLVATFAVLTAVTGYPSHSHGDHEQGHSGMMGHDGHGLGPGTSHDHSHGHEEEHVTCSPENSHDALQASSNFVDCSGLDYADFLALVQADITLLEGTAVCFSTKVDEVKESGKEPDDEDVAQMFNTCVQQVSNLASTMPAEATAEFLQQLLGSDSKICECLPAYVDGMPHCDHWERFSHFGRRVNRLCESIEHADLPLGPTWHPVEIPTSSPAETPSTTESTDSKGAGSKVAGSESESSSSDAPSIENMSSVDEGKKGDGNGRMAQQGQEQEQEQEQEQQQPHFPNPSGPCPPGHTPHPNDPTQCQPPHEDAYDEEPYAQQGPYEQQDDANRAQGQGSGQGPTWISVGAILAVGGMVGFGGAWLWGKYRSSRQPGVRYVAEGAGNDMGTELGPFGREYA